MNCLIIDDDKMSRLLIERFIEKTTFISNFKSFSSAVDAIKYIENSNNKIDLIFLDVEMPEMTGVEFLQVLKGELPPIIIISSKEKYALEAFNLDVTDYLLKPVVFKRFYQAVEKVWNMTNRDELSHNFQEFFIKKNTNLVRVKYSDILWIEALENYIVVNTATEKFTVHHTLKAIVDKMPPGQFYRIHRSYVVNINAISLISATDVKIPTADKQIVSLPLGKSFREKLIKGINVLSK